MYPNISVMQDYGLDEAVVFQTDTTQPDSGAPKLLTSFSVVSLVWLAILNMVLASVGTDALWAGRQLSRTFGW